MTAIELLFAAVVVVAVPLCVRRIRLGEPTADGLIARVVPAATAATAAVAASLAMAPGPVAVVLALPWQAITVAIAVGGLTALVRGIGGAGSLRRLAVATSLGFLAFGAANVTAFAAGFGPLGFAPVIILLTAVHFHAAGFVLMIAGVAAFDRAPTRIAAAGVAGVALGSIVTAGGFVGVPGAAPIGAVVVAIAGLLIGAATLHARPRIRHGSARTLTTIAAVALFVSMPLAIAWALAPSLGLMLDLDAMIRTHGAINALAVAVPISVGWQIDARGAAR